MSDMTFILHVGRNAPASTSPASIALPFASQKLSSSLPDPAIKLPSIFDVLGVPLLRSKGEQGFGLNSIQRAEIETQTQQIDAAIKLLQVQYNAIMSSVRKNQEAQERKFAYQFVLPVRDCSSNIPSQRCPTQMTPQAGAAHRKRAAEESLDDRASKKSVANSCGKLQAALNAGALSERPASFQTFGACVDHTDFLSRFPKGTRLRVCESQTACAIYQLRPKVWDRRRGKPQSQSASIASKHGVTSKTIRDIW
jgi:hypothetical protein